MAEKARLAHENSIYARENRFLREIVEYHQLTMQDVVYLDEGSEEVTEVYPITRMLSISPLSHTSPPSPTEIAPSASPLVKKEIFPIPNPQQQSQEVSGSDIPISGTPAREANKEEAKATQAFREENAKEP